MPTVTVRFFGAAAAATGFPQQELTATTIDELLAALAAAHGQRLRDVLAASSLLVDGVSVRDRSTRLAANSVIDLLPPYAGG